MRYAVIVSQLHYFWIYQDELDKWLECNRKNPVPLTDEEQNAAILAANRRKPNKADWR